ncbi:hypothetical protein ACN23B_00915 [Anabaena sp. FACHB-709]|uniref:Uncharacterized protein n=1 Tax=Anabaena cylindrica FACHB-318 TaxID=2692880 RepID=A0ABR7ZH23_ANACY|nr:MULTISPECIES: hypothetical protein [Nostocaceae]MBD2171949.1 hypothetical protein [Anabaena cylindrica FACHB-318]MBD2284031.1 hypothetical protein [Anabaena cylindrica FACHB-170]
MLSICRVGIAYQNHEPVGIAQRHLLQAGKPFQQLLHLGKPQDRTASPTQWLPYAYFKNKV